MTEDKIKLLNANEVCQMLRISPNTLSRWVRSSFEFPRPIQLGRIRMWQYDDIMDFVYSNKKIYKKDSES